MKRSPDNPKRCQQHVSDSTGWHYPQCSRRWIIEEDNGKWCKQHAPSSVKARQKKAEELWNRNHAERMWPYHEVRRLQAINDKLLEALENTAGRLRAIAEDVGGDCMESDWANELEAVIKKTKSAISNRDPVE